MKEDRKWLGLSEIAEAFDMTPQGFAQSVRPMLAEEDVRRDGRKVKIRVRAAIDAWTKRAVERAVTEKKSAALEDYRSIRASLIKIELEKRQKTHVDVRALSTAFVRMMSLLRRCGETLQRVWGNDASDVLNAALDDALKIIETELKADQ